MPHWRGSIKKSSSSSSIDDAILVKDIGNQEHNTVMQSNIKKLDRKLKAIHDQLDLISGAELDISDLES